MEQTIEEKHVYYICLNGNTEWWYVANSIKHAEELWEEYQKDIGYDLEDIIDMKDKSEFELCDDDKLLICYGDDGNPHKKICREWANERACGFLTLTLTDY